MSNLLNDVKNMYLIHKLMNSLSISSSTELTEPLFTICIYFNIKKNNKEFVNNAYLNDLTYYKINYPHELNREDYVYLNITIGCNFVHIGRDIYQNIQINEAIMNLNKFENYESYKIEII